MKQYSLNKDKYMSDQELHQLTSVLETTGDRDSALIALAIHTGARATELLSIQRSDLDSEHSAVYIRGLKGSRDRWIPLHEDVYELIDKHIPFNISYSRLAAIWYNYRPVKKKFHSLRHTFAVNLYKRTKDVKLVQIALGHTSIMNTQIYVDFVMNIEEMRRIL